MPECSPLAPVWALCSPGGDCSNGFASLLLRLVIAYINDTDKHTFGRRPAPELLPSPKGLGWCSAPGAVLRDCSADHNSYKKPQLELPVSSLGQPVNH